MKLPLLAAFCLLSVVTVAFYSPELGRWMTRDPIGEEDSPNLYVFVRNDPVNNFDPHGMFTLADAEANLRQRRVVGDESTWLGDRRYSDRQLFEEWLRLERLRGAWWRHLPKCPSKLCIRADGTPANPDPDKWKEPERMFLNRLNHPGGYFEMRSQPVGQIANQCIYDSAGLLMQNMPSAGTVDFFSFPDDIWGHRAHDLLPFEKARSLDRIPDYYSVRPSW